MSGVVSPDRIDRSEVQCTLNLYVINVLDNIFEVESVCISGSYNSDQSKDSFGDIDLILNIQAKDKKEAKSLLIEEFNKNPHIIEFEYKGKTKKYHNAGELISIKFKQAYSDKTVQIDNIIALSEEEMDFKKKFLDLPAEKQGLLLGLVKVMYSEFLDIGNFEGDLSSTSIRMRNKDNDVLYSSQNWSSVEKILTLYNLNYNDSFETFLDRIKLLSQRSRNRIKGLFKKMVSIKSGEVGTEKAKRKQKALDEVEKL